jgi:hypothetical protein
MPNALLTPTAVTRKALKILHQKCNFIGSINRQYDDSFAVSGAKIGDTLKIRLPNEYVVRTGATLATQDTTETNTTLQIATQKGVDLNFTSVDLTLSLDDFSTRILDPAMARLAAAMESDAMSMYADVAQQVNNTGASATYNGLLDGRTILQRSLAPPGDRTANLNPLDMANIVKDTKTLFNNQEAIGKQYKEGYVGRAAGFDFMENTLWPAHQRGAAAATYTTSTQVGALPLVATPVTQITVATGTGAAAKGEVFTIAGVFSVHPESKQSTGQLQQFTVATAYAGGAGTVQISPSIIMAGAAQNVVIPSTSATAAIAFAGTISTPYGVSMLYHKDAFTFATADLVMPSGVDFSARESYDGMSIRVVRQYDINNDKFPCRLDVLYGWKTIRPQWAVRYANS